MAIGLESRECRDNAALPPTSLVRLPLRSPSGVIVREGDTWVSNVDDKASAPTENFLHLGFDLDQRLHWRQSNAVAQAIQRTQCHA